jgi:hypothetical protein
VERAIRYIRDAFFAGRTFTDLADLNAQAEAWCLGQAADRRCPEDISLSVREAFDSEAPRLLALPENPYPTDEQVAVTVGKTPYVRFDLNDYSVPYQQVLRTLTVAASLAQVAPRSRDLLVRAAERGHSLGAITSALLRLLERFGAAELQAGIEEALARDVPHSNAVRHALERRREARDLPPPVAIILPDHVQRGCDSN